MLIILLESIPKKYRIFLQNKFLNAIFTKNFTTLFLKKNSTLTKGITNFKTSLLY
jgi:hypothetical protein